MKKNKKAIKRYFPVSKSFLTIFLHRKCYLYFLGRFFKVALIVFFIRVAQMTLLQCCNFDSAILTESSWGVQ